MKIRTTMVLLMLAAMPLAAQTGKLNLNFDHLAAKAVETVDINLEGQMLRLATQFLSNHDPDQRRVREAITGLTGIYVKRFEFDQRGAYALAEMDKVRAQLDSSWERIVSVRSKHDDNVEVFVRPGEKTTRGIVIIAAEPTEFTVVQIAGEIDLEKLGDLEGEFGIPEKISKRIPSKRQEDN